ncbi:MAG: succinylglutamate desuccinylase/aspartoacylase family protein [Candidatus Adlerbacteria bacterium]|nr:succinylglutamate desuccinylase/aspartoacylase family protein [Candidatus Adlerbacteria bacterium]
MFGFFSARKKAESIIRALPVADITGAKAGPTLLVTAGLDGDEYAGIEAAYAAAEKYSDGNFSGRLIILPLVNMPGFEAGVSHNPLDKKFPKYCIPGRAHGSPTERLMYYIVQTCARSAVLWLDLHSGARDEITTSCLWNDITGVPEVDARGELFTQHSGALAAVREHAGRRSKALAAYDCAYVLAESEDATQHMRYIERAMQQLGMLAGQPPTETIRIFTKTRDMYTLAEEIKTGEVLLWHKTAPSARKGERAGEIAYDELKG